MGLKINRLNIGILELFFSKFPARNQKLFHISNPTWIVIILLPKSNFIDLVAFLIHCKEIQWPIFYLV